MQPSNQHSLVGKARRVRDVGRSQRMYTQQLIEEYLESELPSEPRERDIPIRRACEFLPSADVPTSTGPDDSGAGQFEYATTLSEPIADAASSEVEETRIRLDRTPPAEKGRQAAERVHVIRPPRIGVTLPIGPTRSKEPSPRGFFIGCAIGTAAAFALLLILRLLVGG